MGGGAGRRQVGLAVRTEELVSEDFQNILQ